VIEAQMELSGVDDLRQNLAAMPPRVITQVNDGLRPLLYSALSSSLQKYFGGSSPARGPAGKLLTMRSGDLFNSVLASLESSVQSDGVTFTFGSDLPYAAIQEYGGVAGRPGPFKKKTGRRPYLPPRPYLNPAMDDLQETLPGLLDQVLAQVQVTE
jgi:phage gpG-like protein